MNYFVNICKYSNLLSFPPVSVPTRAPLCSKSASACAPAACGLDSDYVDSAACGDIVSSWAFFILFLFSILIVDWLGSDYLGRIGLIATNPGPVVDYSKLKGCRIFHQNANSLSRKMSKVKDILRPFKSKAIIAFTESCLQNTMSDAYTKIPHYNTIRFDHKDRKSLGVVVFYTKDIRLVTHTVTSTPDFTLLVAEFLLGRDRLFFGCLYRLPCASNRFFADFDNELEKLVHSNRRIVLIGDTNINLTKVGASQTRYLEILHHYELNQLISDPTRIQPNSQTLIDHILATSTVKGDHIFNSDTFLSDHNMIGFRMINFGMKVCAPIQMQTCRLHVDGLGLDFGKCDLTVLKTVLAQANWGENLQYPGVGSVDDKFTNYVKVLTEAARVATPAYPCKCGKQKPPEKEDAQPWFNKQLKFESKACSDFHKYIVNAKKSGTIVLVYKIFRNRYIRNKEKARNNYYKNLVEGCDYKNRWKIINTIRNNNKSADNDGIEKISQNGVAISDKRQIANCLNEYFSEIGKKTVENVRTEAQRQGIATHEFLRTTPQDSFHFSLPTSLEILTATVKLKENKPSGPMGIPVKIFKDIISVIITPTTNLFHSFVLQSRVPSLLKAANVTPIFKKGDNSNPTNYRPISVTSVISKIFETVMKTQIEAHLERFDVLSVTQYGFRRKHSTVHAMIAGTDKAIAHLNSEQDRFATYLYLDLSKAFDCVDHYLLSKSLNAIGFDEPSTRLTISLLDNRPQAVKMSNIKSNTTTVNTGVAQGSILGPLLFTIFVNDCNVHLGNLNTHIIQYADDVCILSLATNYENILTLTETNLTKAHTYFTSLGLKLNISKTQYMPITNSESMRPYLRSSVLFRGSEKSVTAQRTAINLGLTMDDCFNFNDHKNLLYSRLATVLQSIRCIRSQISQTTAKLLYQSLFLGIHNYAACVFDTHGHGTNAINEKLEILHRKMLRCIYKYHPILKPVKENGVVTRNPSNNLLYRVSGETTLATKRNISTLTMVYDALHSNSPSEISSLVGTSHQSSRDDARVFIPRIYRTNLMKHSFAFRSSNLWSKTGRNIRNARNRATFVQLLVESCPGAAGEAE
jgi:hypothetical protein